MQKSSLREEIKSETRTFLAGWGGGDLCLCLQPRWLVSLTLGQRSAHMLALEEPTAEPRDLKLEMSAVWRERDELGAPMFKDHGGGGGGDGGLLVWVPRLCGNQIGS